MSEPTPREQTPLSGPADRDPWAALRDSEARLRAVVNSAVSGIVTIDECGRIESVNPAVQALFGYSPDEMIGRNVNLLMPEPDASRHDGYLEHYRQTGERQIIGIGREVMGRRKDGSVFPVDLAVSEFSERGRRMFTGVMRDLTRRKVAEEALRKSNAGLRLLSAAVTQLLQAHNPVELLPELFTTLAAHLGADVHLSYMVRERDGQPGLHSYSGVDPETASRAASLDLGEYVCGTAAQARASPVLSDVQRQTDEKAALVRSMGIRAYVCHPLVANGRLIGTLSFGTRQRDRFDDEDVELVRALADQVAMALDRARLMQELRQQAAGLAEANRAKDRFFAMLSHELRTPLAPVLAAVTAMQDDPRVTAETRSLVDMVRRNVELEARLIDDLLDLNRVTRGKLRLHLDTVDLHELIGNALETCQGELRAKEVRLSVALAAGEHYVRGDAARLQQILWNVVKNAIKFTPGGGEIRVRTGNEGSGSEIQGSVSPAPIPVVIVEVSDTGIGIEPEVLPRIFNAFEQGEASVTRRFGGLGLGLAIAKAIAEAHDGTLTATSAGREQGSTFALRLHTVPRPAARTADLPASAGARSGPLRVLLVEDHVDTLLVMARLLTGMGHEVECAGSVEAARALATVRPFDLVISDLGLPDGSGLDLMRELKQAHKLNGIALSGYGMEEDVRQSREAGFDLHLTKPINHQQLRAAVEQVGR